MRQYVPSQTSSDIIPVTGEKTGPLSLVTGAVTVLPHKRETLTGFSKLADYEETYRVDLAHLLPVGSALTEVIAWTNIPAYVTSVKYDDTRVDIKVGGGEGGERYVVSVAFSVGNLYENKVNFVVKPYGILTITYPPGISGGVFSIGDGVLIIDGGEFSVSDGVLIIDGGEFSVSDGVLITDGGSFSISNGVLITDNPAAILTFSPTSLAFPATDPGASAEMTVTVTNTGDAAATITSFSVTGAAFAAELIS